MQVRVSSDYFSELGRNCYNYYFFTLSIRTHRLRASCENGDQAICDPHKLHAQQLDGSHRAAARQHHALEFVADRGPASKDTLPESFKRGKESLPYSNILAR